jgi:chromate transporter
MLDENVTRPVDGRHATRKTPHPRRELFLVWLKASVQNVGGGGTAQVAAYNDLVRRRAWFTTEEWAECWAVCQVVPGVNMIALALLTGSRIAGRSGAAASFAGLVLPASVVTLIIASLYARIHTSALQQAGLHGLIAAGVGASVVTSFRLATPVLRGSAAQGRAVVVVAVLIVVGSMVLIETGQVPAFALLLGGGAVMAATLWTTVRSARKRAL